MIGLCRIQARSAVVACIGALGGCATDVIVSDVVKDKATVAGVVYALPMGQVQVVATRKAITSESLDGAKKAAEAAKTKLTDDTKLLTAAKADLDKLKGQLGIVGAAGQSDLTRDVAVAQALVDYLTAVVKSDTGASEAADKRLASLSGAKGGFEETVKFTQLANAPDPNARRVAYLHHDVRRTDKINIGVSNGLLSTATGTSTDETLGIILSLVQFAAAAGNPAGGFSAPAGDRAFDPEAPTCATYSYAAVFDPMKPAEVTEVGSQLTSLSDAIYLRIGGFQCLQGECTGQTTGVAGKTENAQGLQYRAPINVTVSVMPSHIKKDAKPDACGISAKFEAQTVTFAVPDPNTAFMIDTRAGAFTTSSLGYTFKDGMLVTADQTRPSELAQAAGFPFLVLKTAASVPAEILKLRVDYDSQANARAKAAVENINQQAELVKALTALEAQRAAATVREPDGTVP